MKKIHSSLVFFFLISRFLFCQDIKIETTYKFNHPFGFTETWDHNEGYPYGPSMILFKENYMIIPDSTDPWSWKWCPISNLHQLNSEKSSQGGIVLRPETNIGLGSTDTEIILFLNRDPFSTQSYQIDFSSLIDQERLYGTPLYLTGNMLFAQVGNQRLASWELLSDGKTFYRDSRETEIWLKANAQKVGYRVGKYDDIYFGDFTLTEQALALELIWESLIYPEQGLVTNYDDLREYHYIGLDKKGLNYYLRFDPKPSQRGLMVKTPIRVSLCIIDTWTRKVTAFELPSNAWNPPRNEEMGLLGTFPWAVAPSGDIYFFDADVQKQEYILKKVQNGWWAGLGVDKRRIGRVNENYIPLQVSASPSVTNNGYNYQHEFVWILEESKTTAPVDDKAVPWVKVRKIDGREGWMLLSELYFE